MSLLELSLKLKVPLQKAEVNYKNSVIEWKMNSYNGILTKMKQWCTILPTMILQKQDW